MMEAIRTTASLGLTDDLDDIELVEDIEQAYGFANENSAELVNQSTTLFLY